VAERDVGEVAAHVRPLGDLQAGAEQHGRHQAGAERRLDAELEAVLDDADASVEIHCLVVEAAPAAALVGAAQGADLLVVGSRGHGGFRGLLLGSVSQRCARSAPCPVAIVRARPG